MYVRFKDKNYNTTNMWLECSKPLLKHVGAYNYYNNGF